LELANRSENTPKEVIPVRINGTRAHIAIRRFLVKKKNTRKKNTRENTFKSTDIK